MNNDKCFIVTDIFSFEHHIEQALPLFASRISAGFPSPADDYIDTGLDLNEHLVKHPAATFFVRVEGESMVGAGIHSGDILVIDRAIEPIDGKVVIAVVNAELTVKRISWLDGKLRLVAENPDYAPIEISSETDFTIWGVVTYVIHRV